MEVIRMALNNFSIESLEEGIKQHKNSLSRYEKLDKYYQTIHPIKYRINSLKDAPNNKMVHSFPKYITDIANGYMFANPLIIQEEEDFYSKILTSIDSDTHDAELGKDLSVFGRAYELIYLSEDKNIRLALIDPRNIFLVYGESYENKVVFGVYYYKSIDDIYRITVYTENEILEFTSKNLDKDFILEDENIHFFGKVPIVHYWNNEEGMGDFEPVLSLIDAYDILQSDRLNDKERFVNAILLIKNATLDSSDKVFSMLKSGILELPGSGENSADASYLTKSLNESETEVLKKSISSDIHKFSHTPDFTDEKFAGNTSGVAIKFKLLSLEYLAKIKERFFLASFKTRLLLIENFHKNRGQKAPSSSDVDVVFNRTLPSNELENARTVDLLKDIVSKESLLTQIDFIKDIDKEIERLTLDKEKNESLEDLEK